ncbi:MAG: hemolysin III family protein [Litoreibacter sp.]|nr:hemolysin III family protein [Litoreibacter sp.]
MSHVSVREYPVYATSEKVADTLVHLAGIVATLVAVFVFVSIHFAHLEGALRASLWLYWSGLLIMLVASFCYHMTPWEGARATLRRLDYAAIYLKIAATYTPFVVMIGTTFSYIVLATVWLLAAYGAGRRLFAWRSPGRMALYLYLGLGWISVALIWAIFQLSAAAGWCAIAGGALYTFGTVFFCWDSLKYANAIWHGFVVIASGFFFASVWLCSLA